MSDAMVTLQEAKAIKKKITVTVMMLLVAAIGTGVALFFVAAPAHAFAEAPPAEDYQKIGTHVALQAVPKAERASSFGASIDFSKSLLSLRSREAQESLGNAYRPLRPELAEKNLDINRAYDAPLATTSVRREIVAEAIDETLVKRGEEEKRLDAEVKKGSSGGGSTSSNVSGEGSARIASIQRQIPEAYQELYTVILNNVKEAEQLWFDWVGGNRSRESNKLLDQAKILLVEARDTYRVIREGNQDIDALDYVGSYVATMIYDINKSNTGSY